MTFHKINDMKGPELHDLVASDSGHSAQKPDKGLLSSEGDYDICAECQDQPGILFCIACDENFCQVCCMSVLHRTGKRRKHKLKQLISNRFLTSRDKKRLRRGEALEEIVTLNDEAEMYPPSAVMHTDSGTESKDNTGSESDSSTEDEAKKSNSAKYQAKKLKETLEESLNESSDASTETDDELLAEMDGSLLAEQKAEILQEMEENGISGSLERSSLVERVSYIPMRLSLEERKELRLLEAALNVSEYTDKIDIISYTPRNKRIAAQLREICSILTGLVVASDMKKGQALIEERDFQEQALYFQHLFEIGRRYKIMNPDRMRATYGKMMYMLQDSVNPDIQEILGFTLYTEILTVQKYLEQKGALAILRDDLLVPACSEIISTGKPRHKVQAEIKHKERAIEILSRKYCSHTIERENIRQVLYSMGDHAAYLRANRDPVKGIRKYLFKIFDPTDRDSRHSLAISAGTDGARLTHSHKTQFQYVNQSLILWGLIMDEMFQLWSLTDDDLLSRKNRYHLKDTGQGLNRIQACPSTSRAIHNILYKAQKLAGSWIGSSAIHLGDHNVPNALMFIDKYLQVPRILNPVVLVLQELEKLAMKQTFKKFIEDNYGSTESLIQVILQDFFRYAFDGSGADSFFDAGSCIDGRLTSAWNWANKIEKKPYYRFFLMAGFTGFDGSGF